jgi:hypothetical protein
MRQSGIAGDRAGAHVHVGEGVGAEIDVVTTLLSSSRDFGPATLMLA